MRFKRPQVRYAETPQPATPYQSAAQVWDERIGSARVQAKNWRLMAFGSLLLALLMAGGLVWRSAQSIVTPYVVEVDNTGQVRAIGEAATPYRPTDAQTAHHIARFITLVRSLSIDPIVTGLKSFAFPKSNANIQILYILHVCSVIQLHNQITQ